MGHWGRTRAAGLALAMAIAAGAAASQAQAAVETYEGHAVGDVVTIQNLTHLTGPFPLAAGSPTAFTVANLGDAHGNVVAAPWSIGSLGAITFFGLFGSCYPGDPAPPSTPYYCGATVSFDYLVLDNTSGRPNAGDLAWAPFSFVVGNLDGYTDPEKIYGRVFLDNVEVVRTYIAVPEPEAWAVLVLGLGLVGGAMRRRGVTRGAAEVAA